MTVTVVVGDEDEDRGAGVGRCRCRGGVGGWRSAWCAVSPPECVSARRQRALFAGGLEARPGTGLGRDLCQCRLRHRNVWHSGTVQLPGQPGESRRERGRSEDPIVLALLSHDRAVNPVCTADCAQRVRGDILPSGVGIAVGGLGDHEPARHATVGAVPGDDCGRIERRPRCSVAAEQSCDGLLFGSHIGAGIAGDVDERTEEGRATSP